MAALVVAEFGVVSFQLAVAFPASAKSIVTKLRTACRVVGRLHGPHKDRTKFVKQRDM